MISFHILADRISGVNEIKFAGVVDNLISRTLAWEKEKQKLFLYDGVSDLNSFNKLQVFECFAHCNLPVICRCVWCQFWRTTNKPDDSRKRRRRELG